jgi:cation:H+ antiporter
MHRLDAQTVLSLLASLAVILASAELFTNGIEWLGHRLKLAEGAVGSVLAAIGTALPETLIPFVAILVGRSPQDKDIGVGAILGAPFMLATLAMFVTGVAAVASRARRPQGIRLIINRKAIGRDLGFFLATYAVAVGASFVRSRALHVGLCVAALAAYLLYLRLTLTDPAAANGEIHALRFQRLLTRFVHRRSDGEDTESYRERLASLAHHPPRLRVIFGQVALALAGIVGGAYIFIGAAERTAEALGVAPLLVALVIAPVATELPEKFNSVVWIREGKDTYALGNITGAMVFQSSFPVGLGMGFTAWQLLAPPGQPQSGIYSAGLALGGGLWLLLMVLLAPQAKAGPGHPPRARLHPGALLAGGLLYLAFIALLVTGA